MQGVFTSAAVVASSAVPGCPVGAGAAGFGAGAASAGVVAVPIPSAKAGCAAASSKPPTGAAAAVAAKDPKRKVNFIALNKVCLCQYVRTASYFATFIEAVFNSNSALYPIYYFSSSLLGSVDPSSPSAPQAHH